MKIDVKNCARCGVDHAELEFEELTRPSGEWTHYAECPGNGEPIMLAVDADPVDFREELTKSAEEHGLTALFASWVMDDHSQAFVHVPDGFDKMDLERFKLHSEGLTKLAEDTADQYRKSKMEHDRKSWTPMKGNCPRRANELGGATGLFITEDGKDYWRDDHTCTYCGSLDPEYLIKMIEEEGWTVTRAVGKGYKSYVHDGEGRMVTKLYHWHLTKDQGMRLDEALEKVRDGA